MALSVDDDPLLDLYSRYHELQRSRYLWMYKKLQRAGGSRTALMGADMLLGEDVYNPEDKGLGAGVARPRWVKTLKKRYL